MDRQIVDPSDLDWRPTLQNEKDIYIAAVQIVPRFQIVMLDNSSLT